EAIFGREPAAELGGREAVGAVPARTAPVPELARCLVERLRQLEAVVVVPLAVANASSQVLPERAPAGSVRGEQAAQGAVRVSEREVHSDEDAAAGAAVQLEAMQEPLLGLAAGRGVVQDDASCRVHRRAPEPAVRGPDAVLAAPGPGARAPVEEDVRVE